MRVGWAVSAFAVVCIVLAAAPTYASRTQDFDKYCKIMAIGSERTAKLRDKGVPRGKAAIDSMDDKSKAASLKKVLDQMEHYAFDNPHLNPDSVGYLSYVSCRLRLIGALNIDVQAMLKVAVESCQAKNPGKSDAFYACAEKRLAKILKTRTK